MDNQSSEGNNQRVVGLLILVGIAALAVSRVHVSSDTLTFLVLLIPTVICHEVAHGAVAYKFGDDTAKNAGRLTANPLKHIDPFGTVLLPALLLASNLPPFGYAKPVPVSLNKLRDPRTHGLLVGLAGPFTNFALTMLSVAVFGALWHLGIRGSLDSPSLLQFVFIFGEINIFIGVFNLLPIPPLDGSSVLEFFLPKSMRPAYYQVRRYAMFLLLFLVLVGNNGFGRVLTTIEKPFFNQYVKALKCVSVGCEQDQRETVANALR